MTAFCPLCKIQSPDHFSVRDLNQDISDTIFHYYRCSSCGLIYLFPVPDDLGSYYISTYPAYQIPNIQDIALKAEDERYKLEIVKKFFSQGRLLEIGPAYGGFAYLAKEAGFEVDAIEMDSRCCTFLNEVLGIRALNSTDIPGTVQELPSYDVIALWHVIEHLQDPWGTLKALSDKLRPGGIIVMLAPNPASLQFRIFGRFWAHVDAPRHLQLIPMKLLAEKMESFGLHMALTTTRGKASGIFHVLGWWRASFRNIIKASRLMHQDVPAQSQSNGANKVFSKISLFFSLGYRFLFFLLLKPFEGIEGLGVAYTVVAQKIKAHNDHRDSR